MLEQRAFCLLTAASLCFGTALACTVENVDYTTELLTRLRQQLRAVYPGCREPGLNPGNETGKSRCAGKNPSFSREIPGKTCVAVAAPPTSVRDSAGTADGAAILHLLWYERPSSLV
jgi:hypothetical protein